MTRRLALLPYLLSYKTVKTYILEIMHYVTGAEVIKLYFMLN